MDRQSWRKYAECKELSGEDADNLFFLERGQKSANAKRFCSVCSVRKECLIFAVIHGETGIWGGYTDTEREGMARFILNGIQITTVVQEVRGISEWLPASLFKVNPQEPDQTEDYLVPISVAQTLVQRQVSLALHVQPVFDPQFVADAVMLAEELLAAL